MRNRLLKQVSVGRNPSRSSRLIEVLRLHVSIDPFLPVFGERRPLAMSDSASDGETNHKTVEHSSLIRGANSLVSRSVPNNLDESGRLVKPDWSVASVSLLAVVGCTRSRVTATSVKPSKPSIPATYVSADSSAAVCALS